MSELDDIRAELVDLREVIKHERRKRRKDKRPNFNLRLNPDEAAVFEAACTERGICKSDLIRAGLNAILGTAFPLNRKTPPELQRWVNQRKTQDPVFHSLTKRKTLIDAKSAMHERMPVVNAIMTEAPSASPLAQGMLTERKR